MNSTKTNILRCLSDGEWWTTSDVANDCGLGLTNVSELLRRYRSQSLVNRRRNYSVARGYLYCITPVGLERLEYLTSEVVETSSVIARHVDLKGNRKRLFDQWVKQRLRR